MKALSIEGLLLIGIAVFSPIGTEAQWPYRVEDDLLATGSDTFAGSPWAAADGTGGAYLAWDDNRNSALSGRDIYIQHFDVQGFAQWTADGVAVVTALDDQIDPIVVSAGADSVFVVWTDSRLPGNPRVYAQRFNAAGVPQWAANGVRAGANTFAQTRAAAVGDEAGNLFVIWAEATNDSRTFVQKFDAAGVPRWGPGGLGFSGGMAINVVPDGAGGAVVGWIQFGDSSRTVWVQRIMSDGTPAFAPVGFGNDTEALGSFLAMVSDGTGGAIVGWQSDSGTDDNIYLQRLDGSGSLTWGTTSLPLVVQPGVQDNLQLAADGSGGVFAAWDDPRSGTSDVYVQRIDATGTAIFPVNGMAVALSGHERRRARLVQDGAGGVIVAFHRDQDGLFAQKIGPDGSRVWGYDGSPVTGNGSVTEPRLVAAPGGDAILSFIAFTNGNRPALKRILGNGRLTPARLVNIPTRAFVGADATQAIPGFVVSGGGEKSLLIRAVGPTLGEFGVAGALADPTLKLFGSANAEIATRDNWQDGDDAAQIASVSAGVGAFALADGSLDAAILKDLGVGGYTTTVSGVEGGSGVALLEIYDADPAEHPGFLANLSSRVFVGTGEQQAIPGFVIAGDGTLTLLIRAIGPTLAAFGVSEVLADPILTLFHKDDVAIAANDDWAGAGTAVRIRIADTAAKIGAFDLASNSRDSALLVTLPAGRYTASAAGAGGGTGICLIEIYVVP